MAIERERKFIVRDQSWRADVTKTTELKQAYIQSDDETSVRVRKTDAQGFLTIKAGSNPLRRLEFEYEIPVADAEALIRSVCKEPMLQKVRHYVPTSDGLVWEVDEFAGHLRGLIIAEVELPSDADRPILPSWIGEEVTDDHRYLNANLSKRDPRLSGREFQE